MSSYRGWCDKYCQKKQTEAAKPDGSGDEEEEDEPDPVTVEKPARKKRNTRPKQSLSDILRSKVEKNTSKLPQDLAFKETVKYVKNFLPDAANFGKITTSKKGGKCVLMITMSGDVDVSSIAGSM